MHLTEDIAKNILCLNPRPELNIIDPQLAERQFQVIVKGFNHLLHPENNFLYIGDEVGLGKTYVALGIASLLRLYSDNHQNYTDTILVPKENLQYKWQKEIRNFISNNYLREDNIVKTVLGNPVGYLGSDCLKTTLRFKANEFPQYVIYRNSSFSIASEEDDESTAWIDKLQNQLPVDQQPIFKRISSKFKKQPQKVKRAFAYLLNHKMPDIDLLIVDEAHNFKHGVGNGVSVRNQIVSRMFGANTDDDELFEYFPELKDFALPKIKKLLLLSATPINTSLFEIKNQLDCFLPKHSFTGLGATNEDEQKINAALNNFMIRGVMNVTVNDEGYSRNGYRHEHRKGNVKMDEIAEFQRITDNSTALFLSLMQYKTIKELKQKNNSQFELGLLAGFESFNSAKSTYESDTLEDRNQRDAKDEFVIGDLVNSYVEEFNDYPPHPKQESLVDELFSLIKERQKALVFVRRIASVRELERKLFKRYSDYLIEKIKNSTKGIKIDSISSLLNNYENENIRDKIENKLDDLSDKISGYLKRECIDKFGYEIDVDAIINSDLKEIYNALIENEDIQKLKDEVKAHVRLQIIKTELKDLAIRLIRDKWYNNLLPEDEEDDDEVSVTEPDHNEELAPYFFQRFFNDEGKKFKNRAYKKDWFELNLLRFNDRYNLFSINQSSLQAEVTFNSEVSDLKRLQELNKIIIQAIKSTASSSAQVRTEYRTNTFLTELLLELCDDEFSIWVDNHKTSIDKNFYSKFLDELDVLIEIVKSIFRQGSGLIPTFIAEAKTSNKEDFILEMKKLLKGEFDFVLYEVKQIILDYNKLVERNFDNINKIRYNLIQQLPITGVSGQHKRDVRKTAIQFRMPGYPYVLITTDILKEGEDLHSYCKNIYHYGIAWNPSDMEQRTGRIDRIDSLAYRSLKNIAKENKEIPFVNKLQVFYPYLSDTLEINQMIKLFTGMDKFIEIFYNDLSAKIERSSKANVDDVVNDIDIPCQRTGLLTSKYEHESFNSVNMGNPLKIKEPVGILFDELLMKIEHLNHKLHKGYVYFVEPEFDSKRLQISGVMNIFGRQGPFKLYLQHRIHQFDFILESILGRVQVFGKQSNRVQTNSLLEKYRNSENLNFELVESNSFVYISLTLKFDTDIDVILKHLYCLIEVTDDIENQVAKTDEVIDTIV